MRDMLCSSGMVLPPGGRRKCPLRINSKAERRPEQEHGWESEENVEGCWGPECSKGCERDRSGSWMVLGPNAGLPTKELVGSV